MDINSLIADEDAVSPVIGVILMVAITVILAAVIGTFVLGLGDNVQDSSPQANFQFEYRTVNISNGDTVETTITHTGGEDVEAGNIEVQVDGVPAYPTEVSSGNVTAAGFTGTISTGTSKAYNVTTATNPSTGTSVETGSPTALASGYNYIQGGDSVRVIWTSPSGGSSQTIGQSTVPS